MKVTRITIIAETDGGPTLVYAPAPDDTISLAFDTTFGVVERPNHDTGCMERERDGTVTVTATVRGRLPDAGLWLDRTSARQALHRASSG